MPERSPTCTCRPPSDAEPTDSSAGLRIGCRCRSLIASAPRVARVNPLRGPAVGGTKVTIEVVGFPDPLNTGSAVDVKFGSVHAAGATVLGPAKLEVLTPSGLTGPVDVTVTHG